jgi:hypothetical protein
MEYPALVYKAQGRHSRPGGTYDFIGVNSQEEFQQKIKEGWFESLEAAITGVSQVAAQPNKKSNKQNVD